MDEGRQAFPRPVAPLCSAPCFLPSLLGRRSKDASILVHNLRAAMGMIGGSGMMDPRWEVSRTSVLCSSSSSYTVAVVTSRRARAIDGEYSFERLQQVRPFTIPCRSLDRLESRDLADSASCSTCSPASLHFRRPPPPQFPQALPCMSLEIRIKSERAAFLLTRPPRRAGLEDREGDDDQLTSVLDAATADARVFFMARTA